MLLSIDRIPLLLLSRNRTNSSSPKPYITGFVKFLEMALLSDKNLTLTHARLVHRSTRRQTSACHVLYLPRDPERISESFFQEMLMLVLDFVSAMQSLKTKAMTRCNFVENDSRTGSSYRYRTVQYRMARYLP